MFCSELWLGNEVCFTGGEAGDLKMSVEGMLGELLVLVFLSTNGPYLPVNTVLVVILVEDGLELAKCAGLSLCNGVLGSER